MPSLFRNIWTRIYQRQNRQYYLCAARDWIMIVVCTWMQKWKGILETTAFVSLCLCWNAIREPRYEGMDGRTSGECISGNFAHERWYGEPLGAISIALYTAIAHGLMAIFIFENVFIFFCADFWRRLIHKCAVISNSKAVSITWTLNN